MPAARRSSLIALAVSGLALLDLALLASPAEAQRAGGRGGAVGIMSGAPGGVGASGFRPSGFVAARTGGASFVLGAGRSPLGLRPVAYPHLGPRIAGVPRHRGAHPRGRLPRGYGPYAGQGLVPVGYWLADGTVSTGGCVHEPALAWTEQGYAEALVLRCY